MNKLLTKVEAFCTRFALRAESAGPFQINLWIPDPAPVRDSAHEASLRAFLSTWGPPPAPYPVQRGLTAAMRVDAQKLGDIERMQAWAGQSAALARAEPAARILDETWTRARSMLAA